MALPNLTDQNIQDTYQRVVTTEGGIYYDGTGSLLNLGSSDEAESIHIAAKNTSGDTITKGTPVYITGNVGGSEKLTIAAADASDPNKMPSVGLAESTLANNTEGFIAQGGYLRQIPTATIDGTSTTPNDTIYVKAGGGLTMTRPTGSALIQNIAKVARSHHSAGSIIVSSILRTNDVPNLPTGKIWVGNNNTVTSSVLSIDEPGTTVEIAGNISASSTGSFGRVICTTISASTGEFDANTIFIGGTPFNKNDLDTLKEGKAINTSPKNLGEGDTGKANIVRPEAIMSPVDDSTYHKFTVPGRMGSFISGTLFRDFNLSGSNNYARIGDGNTDIQLKGNINDATLDGGTF